MINTIKQDAKNRMEKTLSVYLSDVDGIRTGRARASVLDGIVVETYGGRVKLNTISSISVSDNKTLLVKVWDINNVGAIKTAIINSNLGFGFSCEGAVIRLTVPDMTQDMRKNLVKLLGKISEDCRISIRNIRRDIMDKLKIMQDNKDISEDDLRIAGVEIQKITDEIIKKINDTFLAKEKELLHV
ncbi:ribosome recycling factor [Ehrlichia ruminantium]|uniref:Ribosome-recycling factor n=1 Tax=Ehrlichia ruminantium (strain Gardel) TaxID=302409 RepID=RRF_EHRRG|nr:ribosome recycling factor [Ehrlichia ruminantium]Q5FG66.1 RecName: Full=Ribosome-recycling factor; Short=RRF; AltName: Full=Ribosome-releasing factor [Ehrlichia ruminantium str. Gardel]KYW91156.1 ribosome recycling factor [Ehrlichia ruminantium]QLK50806.1 ribosome recycling factor [Ehrlichia ruminantium]QLK51728.1 ribosome recycling factor [Ehrlichia ruminantium]QLK53567.1 ribosome recycling factor [Ehrlichia ruminantium]UOD98616.1 ribosome recycling factor [Ehrlichia ruminantium]